MRYLGQHFLKNKNIVKKIANLADLSKPPHPILKNMAFLRKNFYTPFHSRFKKRGFFGCGGKNDVVLEVGPGKGVLTEELLNRAKKVMAVEKDKQLCEFLNKKFNYEIKNGKLVLIVGDILKIFKLELPKKYKIVANIPYYITSRFLKIFLEEAKIQPQKMVLMIQKEVAERICETPPKSVLAVSVQVYSEPKIAFKVSAGNFFPPPKVDSAVIVIDEISKKFFNDISENFFFRIVKCGFSKKRKILLNNLSNELGVKKENLEKTFKKCGINNLSRAENLTLQNWKCLCHLLNY